MTLPRTGKTGVVDKAITPHQPGRIKFQGTYWKAELADPDCKRVEVGEPVQVVGLQGIRLLVVPEKISFRWIPRICLRAERWGALGFR